VNDIITVDSKDGLDALPLGTKLRLEPWGSTEWEVIGGARVVSDVTGLEVGFERLIDLYVGDIGLTPVVQNPEILGEFRNPDPQVGDFVETTRRRLDSLGYGIKVGTIAKVVSTTAGPFYPYNLELANGQVSKWWIGRELRVLPAESVREIDGQYVPDPYVPGAVFVQNVTVGGAEAGELVEIVDRGTPPNERYVADVTLAKGGSFPRVWPVKMSELDPVPTEIKVGDTVFASNANYRAWDGVGVVTAAGPVGIYSVEFDRPARQVGGFDLRELTLVKVAPQPEPEPEPVVDEPAKSFQAGDKVRVVGEPGYVNRMAYGKVGTVAAPGRESLSTIVDFPRDNGSTLRQWINDRDLELVVEEPAVEDVLAEWELELLAAVEETPVVFKVGDKVRVVNEYPQSDGGGGENVGRTGVISEIDLEDGRWPYFIQYDDEGIYDWVHEVELVEAYSPFPVIKTLAELNALPNGTLVATVAASMSEEARIRVKMDGTWRAAGTGDFGYTNDTAKHVRKAGVYVIELPKAVAV
jgi:hypothetical protein